MDKLAFKAMDKVCEEESKRKGPRGPFLWVELPSFDFPVVFQVNFLSLSLPSHHFPLVSYSLNFCPVSGAGVSLSVPEVSPRSTSQADCDSGRPRGGVDPEPCGVHGVQIAEKQLQGKSVNFWEGSQAKLSGEKVRRG